MTSISISQIILIVAVLIGAFVTFKYWNQIRKFVLEVVSELKKVSWTNRKDLIDSTWVVLMSSACLGVFIAVIDFVLSRLVALIIK